MRANGYLLSNSDFLEAYNQGRASIAVPPNNGKILSADEINAMLSGVGSVSGVLGNRCPSYEQITTASDSYSYRFSATNLATAQVSAAVTVYITIYYSPQVGYYFYASPNVWLSAPVPAGYYVVSGSGTTAGSGYTVAADGKITALTSLPNVNLEFTNSAITGSSASAQFGALWSTGLKTAGSGKWTNITTTTGSVTISVTRSTGGSAASMILLKNGFQVQSKSAPINSTASFTAVTFAKGDVWSVLVQ